MKLPDERQKNTAEKLNATRKLIFPQVTFVCHVGDVDRLCHDITMNLTLISEDFFLSY